jgi:hypothetical protein
MGQPNDVGLSLYITNIERKISQNQLLSKKLKIISGYEPEKYLKKSYTLDRVLYVLVYIGIAIMILGIILGNPVIILAGFMETMIGTSFIIRSYWFLVKSINSGFTEWQKNLYYKKPDIIRTLYYNTLTYKKPIYISEGIKINNDMYRLFRALQEENTPAYYDKFTALGDYLTNYDLKETFREISYYLKMEDMKTYFQSIAISNKQEHDASVKEIATMKTSGIMIMILILGIISLFIGIISRLQTVVSVIYGQIVSGIVSTSAGASTVLGNSGSLGSLFIFQYITELPPVYLIYLLIIPFAIYIAYKLMTNATSMVK